MKKLTIGETKKAMEQQGARLLKHRYAVPEMDFEEVLYMIEPDALAQDYVDFYNAHPEFAIVPAGARHHHWWKNGLEAHVKEMIGIGFDLLELYPGDLSGISKTDVIVCCFLHDFAKTKIYIPITTEDRIKDKDKYLPFQEFKYVRGSFTILDEESDTLLTLARAGIAPTDKQWSAVLFCEGGYADRNFGFSGPTRTSETVLAHNSLVPFMHMLDMYSSQLLGKSLLGREEEQERRETDEPEPVQADGAGSTGR